MKKYWSIILVVISLTLLTGCTTESPEQKSINADEMFQEQMANLVFDSDYVAYLKERDLTARQTKYTEYKIAVNNYEVTSVEGSRVYFDGKEEKVNAEDIERFKKYFDYYSASQKSAAEGLKNFSVTRFFSTENGVCFYGRANGNFIVACFSDNKIIYYQKNYGPSEMIWMMKNFSTDFRSSEIMALIKDSLYYCEQDSDCTLSDSFLCNNSARNLSTGAYYSCRIAVNKQYSFIIDNFDSKKDECIPKGICADHFKGAVCKNNRCEPVPTYEEKEILEDNIAVSINS